MDCAKHGHICRFFVHRIEFYHFIMVWLGFLCEHGLWRYNTGAKLVLAYGSNKYLPSVYIGRSWWQIGEKDWVIRPVGRIIWSRIGFIHGAFDSILFVQYLWKRSRFDTTNSNVFHCLDGAVQFFYISFWEIQYGYVHYTFFRQFFSSIFFVHFTNFNIISFNPFQVSCTYHGDMTLVCGAQRWCS